jgi:spore coat protein CotH
MNQNKSYMKKTGICWVGAKALSALLIIISVIGLSGCVGQVTGQAADNSSAPFYPDRVVTVRFVMTEENWTYLQEHAREESYVKADMWYDGELVPDIALRPKGNSSLSSAISSGSIRFGLKADLNFFNAARNLDGVKKLNFNNGFSDPTFMREILSYELFEQMGLPTPRVAFVDLYVNDVHLGLYTMVEQIDQTFLAQHFADASGNLYKPEPPAAYLNWTEEDIAALTGTVDSSDINLGGGNLNEIMEALEQDTGNEDESAAAPAAPGFQGGFGFLNQPSDNATPEFNMPDFGNMPSDNASQRFKAPLNQPDAAIAPAAGMGPTSRGDYLEQMGLKTNENKPEYSALLHFLDVLNNEPDETFVEEIKKVLDVDQVLRFLAVSAVLVHLDNYIGMGHNYYLYEVEGKFTIIPWDLNMSFGNFNSNLDRSGIINFMIDEPTAGTVADRPLVARLLAAPEYLEAYHGYISEMINGPFSSEIMNARIDELADMIRPYVAADTLKFSTLQAFESFIGEGPASASDIRFGAIGLNIGLKTFVAERIASIEKQLAGELASTNNGRGNGGSFFSGGFNNFNRMNAGP